MTRSGTADVAVLSNRGPVSFTRDDSGEMVARRAAGGLVATLGPGVREHGAIWLSSAMNDDERDASARGVVEAEGYRLRSVAVDPAQFRQYYDVVANQTLWFLHHGLWDLPRRPRLDRYWWEAWSAFRDVNRQFAEAVAAEVAPGGTVLIHDFQLSLVGAELGRLRPDVCSAVFLHTPFCQPGELQTLPGSVADSLLDGMAGAGAVGFHCQRWAAAFEGCCADRRHRIPPTFVSPAAADTGDIETVAASTECQHALDRLDRQIGDRQLIVRVDRIELSKNLVRGFFAFDELLTVSPAMRGKVVFGAFIYPSRESLAEYSGYRLEVEAVVKTINAKWATPDWTPILLDTADDYARSVAALRRYDVLLVNPVRDGLNLVAKEGPIVNERNGVLALSPYAGAWDELGSHAIEVHPFDVSGTATALLTGLTMADDERAARARTLVKAASARSPHDWFADQLAAARIPNS